MKDMRTENLDKCQDCEKDISIYEGIQALDKYPNPPKYKFVCKKCFKKNKYVYVGKFKRI